MSEDNETFARITCSILDYTHIKNTIMEIFGDPARTYDSSSGVLSVKDKCFYCNSRNNQSKFLRKFKSEQGDKENPK